MECPHCGKDVEETQELEVLDSDERMRIEFDTDDAIDYVFTQLIKEGYAPRSSEIYKIIEYYQDYMDAQILKFLQGVLKPDEGKNNNDH